VPPPGAEEDIDDQSVFSEASTETSLSTAGDQDLSDGDLTPVGSDNEDFLDSAMQNLRIR
jgi:hypothetical protein